MAGDGTYTVAPADEAAVDAIVAGCGLSPLTARVLVARGVDTPDAVKRFLSPSLDADWHDPACIPGLSAVADKVQAAMEAGGRILVFGDFDVDGISATAVAVRGLRALGADACGLIPHRYEEGYALSEAAVRRGMETYHPDLIVTVDCGIACDAEVAAMREAGIDVCITDHHEAGGHVPHDVPVADSKLDHACPSFDLAGAGVALKLVAALGARLGKPGIWRELTDLAALGTISDIMPFTPENRALVADGIARMRTAPRIPLAALAAICNVDMASVTATKLSFSLIPRMNASGRMGDATIAYDLLMSDSETKAQEHARRLDLVNTERRKAEARLSEQVAEAIERDPSIVEAPIIVVGGEGWHEGVKGIVASHLARAYGKPAILFTVEDGQARGSGRSYGGLDLFELASSATDLYERFGGHAAAIGLTLPAERLSELRERLGRELAAGAPPEKAKGPELDALVRVGDCTLEAFAELERLEPFGSGNRAPLLALEHVFMQSQRAIGKTGTHLRYEAGDGLDRVEGIYFNAPDIERLANCETLCDIVFEPQVDEWMGRRRAKLLTREIHVCNASGQPGEVGRRVEELLAGTAPGQGIPRDLGEQERLVQARRRWEGLADERLDDKLRRALIGDSPLHDAQARALDGLAKGVSTLAVMATGRGKSLVFHLHAARTALRSGKASVFVYPLRALVADQAHHLRESYARLGLSVEVLTGETDAQERERVYRGLRDGGVDVVLTTPEYLCIHAADFARSGRVAFLVVDEAHHIGLSRAGNRPAYARLSEALAALGGPLVLATTATAPDMEAASIRSELSIANLVVDMSVRDNLRLDDRRDLASREDYLASIAATGAKCIAYVNSRDASRELARMLRRRLPHLACRVAFYNAGLSKADRGRIERAFRAGELSCVVATSAFGEGIDIPDVEHVVLFHLPFSSIEFNQMSGRVGRDGREAWVHLLYGYGDARINERILATAAPGRKQMIALYRALKARCQAASADGGFTTTKAELAEAACDMDRRVKMGAAEAACGLAVFSELGFLDLSETDDTCRVRMVDGPAHMELADSVRYREGLDQIEEFAAFKQWALSAAADELLARFTRPIVPQSSETFAS